MQGRQNLFVIRSQRDGHLWLPLTKQAVANASDRTGSLIERYFNLSFEMIGAEASALDLGKDQLAAANRISANNPNKQANHATSSDSWSPR